MRPLTLEAYKLLFFITGSKVFSYYAAVLLVTVMNVIVLMGLSLLLEGIATTPTITHFLSFPFNIGVGAVLYIINLFVVPTSFIELTDHIRVKYLKLLLYFGISMVLLAFWILVK